KNYVLKTLKSKYSLVRIASLNALANIGDESDVLTVAMIAASKSGDERNAARSCLALLKSDGVDKVIVSNISRADKSLKIELIRAVGERGSTSAFNALLENIGSKDRQIRAASYTALSDITAKEQLSALAEKLNNIPYESDRKKMERTISRVLLKYPDEGFIADLISNVDTDKSIDNKASSLRLLGYTNSAPALVQLRKSSKSDNQQLKIAAINGLSSWANTDPLYDLLEATEKAENEKVKQPALKGFINFISLDKILSDSAKIELYKKALKYAKTSNEKNMALDGVGHIDNFESLEVIKLYYKDPTVKQTVEDGVNRVGWHLASIDPERVRTYMHEFLKMTTDEKYIAKCNRVLERTDKVMKNRNQ
ncbi:MAG: HEAT repeat domain-containing protein, partial [Melioribacteraceae bacterium]|nr:HEAT repeat domain-containing protein [Melioribacteraceae bacterium]